MSLPRELMNDLISVYLAGEASPATRRAVEEYASEHPDYAESLRAAASPDLPKPADGPPPDLEISALRRTRRFVLLRSIFLASGVFFSLTPFLAHFGSNGWEWLLIGKEPGLIWASASLGAASWVAWWMMQREVRRAGL